jgi:UDP-glucose 4-epimerase
LSEVAGLLGKSYAPVLPPWGTGLAAGVARRLGVRIPPEMLCQMRFGRGLDNRRFKATGYRYRHTTREAVIRLGEHQRLEPLLRGAGESYRYERELEEFLRYSPSVRANAARLAEACGETELERPAPQPGRTRANAPTGTPGYDDLTADEIVALLPSLDADGLCALLAHETANRGRRTVIRAIERLQRWEASP